MLKINKVIKTLILSDLLILTGFGFISPIFAIFLVLHIHGGSPAVAGFAAGIFWITQAIVLIPLGKQLDKNHGDLDDFWYIFIGNILASFIALGYLISTLPWHIYVLQFIYALGSAMNIAGYTGIFTRHVDRGRESSAWSTRAALVSVGAGVAGSLGGIIYEYLGFKILFIGVSILSFLSALILLVILNEMRPKVSKTERIEEKLGEPFSPKI